MAKIIWAPSALKDIESIAEYISRDSPDHAALFIKRLIDSVEHLCDYPLSGRVIPEINDPLCREIIYRSYRLMYRVENQEIWITGVVHAARDCANK